MTPKERMIQRLKDLCALHGVDVVAVEAKVSADNLRQIIAGTKLESGAPRGVGPTLQRKLEAKYPGWADPAIAADQGPRLPGKKFEDRHEVSNSEWATLQAVQALIPEFELHEMRERHAKIKERLLEEIREIGSPKQ